MYCPNACRIVVINDGYAKINLAYKDPSLQRIISLTQSERCLGSHENELLNYGTNLSIKKSSF